MKRFEVLHDGIPTGFIEAVSTEAAVVAAQAQLPTRSKTTLSLRRSELAMHVLIDTSNYRALARHDSPKALAALALIQFNNIDSVILPVAANKSYSVFDAGQLASIATSVGVDLSGVTAYPAKLKAVRSALETLEWLALPFTSEDLQAQAYGLNPKFDGPLAYDPNSNEARELEAWHVEPQRNRARQDSPHWIAFRAGLGYGAGVTTPETLAHLQGSTGACPADVAERMAPSGARRSPPKRPAATPAAPKAPKAPRAPAAPGTRPKEGTSTGKVWEAGDAVHARDASLTGKDLKAAVMEECSKLGVNPGTVNVQFGKWKASAGL